MKPGYKQTEVGAIPEDWEVASLGALGDFSKGSGVRKDEAHSGDLPCVRYGEIYTHHNDVIREYNSRISSAVAKAAKRLRRGDMLFAGSGETKEEIGKTVAFVSDDEAYAGGDIVILSPRASSSEFLGYALNAPLINRQKASKGQGDAVVHIGAHALASIKLALPPLPEQSAIATALSDVDALLAGLDKLIAKKRDLKQATMQQLLTGKTRLPGFAGEWEVKRLGGIAHIQRGASPRPIDSPIWFDENSPVGWVRISDVTASGMYLKTTQQRLSSEGIKHSRPVQSGSLIMSICATVGRPVITRIDVCIHDGFVVFDDLKADRKFIYYVLKAIESDWSKHGQTGSQMNLNTGLINSTSINLPPRDEQAAIAEVLSDLDTELAALEQRREKTRLLKRGMMQELLTGRTRLM